MRAAEAVAVGRCGARGVVIDDEGRLVLIKRTKPGQDPYWTSPGGGVGDSDATAADALRRELAEELGATADGYQQVFLSSDPSDAGVAIQYWLTSLNLSERYGPEFSKPERGGYDLDYASLRDDSRARSTSSRRRSRSSCSPTGRRCSPRPALQHDCQRSCLLCSAGRRGVASRNGPAETSPSGACPPPIRRGSIVKAAARFRWRIVMTCARYLEECGSTRIERDPIRAVRSRHDPSRRARRLAGCTARCSGGHLRG